MLKVLVIGLGSMGKRRIRLIRQYDRTIHIAGVDLSAERRQQSEKIFSITTYGDLETALGRELPDCCFVATAPLSHAAVIYNCLYAGCNVFTELNLVTDRYEENIALAQRKNVVLFLSSTQLYRNELQYIKKQVEKTGEKYNYIYHVGQYLPDWHPWEDYRDFFVRDTRTNACREIMAIEFPWLMDSFGRIKSISRQKSKNSNLDIHYDDNYMILTEHEDGHKGFFCIDLLCRVPVRFLEVFSEELYMKWSGTPESLYEYRPGDKELRQVKLYDKIDKLENYNELIIENDYFQEVEEFFETVKGNAAARYSFAKDKEVLAVIDRIEED